MSTGLPMPIAANFDFHGDYEGQEGYEFVLGKQLYDLSNNYFDTYTCTYIPLMGPQHLYPQGPVDIYQALCMK